jgi:hypothetical protein
MTVLLPIHPLLVTIGQCGQAVDGAKSSPRSDPPFRSAGNWPSRQRATDERWFAIHQYGAI